MRHLSEPQIELLAKNEKIVFPVKNSTTKRLPKFLGLLWYYYSLSIVAFLFLFAMPPVMLLAEMFRKREVAYPAARWGARAWLRLSGMKIVVRGRENLAPDDAGRGGAAYVFVSNHRSYLDTAMMFAYTGRKMGVIAKKELLKLPVAGRFTRYVNVLAIDRSNPERAIETMKRASEKLHAGISFGVFAEGTRALPGELLPFKKGAFHMAMATGFPIVPVAMKNTDRAMGKKTKYCAPTTCEMVLLPPIETKGLTAEKDLTDLLEKVRGMIADELAK
jgi:1-acyl-sn-glycerol-3-phosphate acyltransferase